MQGSSAGKAKAKGGAGLFDTVITGPGKAYRQTMTITKPAKQMITALPDRK